jgi:hypothetical protein
MDVQERLRRHVELMAQCTAWTEKAQAAFAAGNHGAADRYLKRAEKFLQAAKAL